MNDRTKLVEYEAMRAQIARVDTLDEARDIRDKHKAMQAYANQAMDFENERACARIRIRAERRLGELLADTAERGERVTKTSGPPRHVSDNSTHTLADIGISRDQSSQWQRLARVPEPDFEAALAAPGIPSTSGIIETHKLKTEPPPVLDIKPIDGDTLWLWGRLREFEESGILDKSLDRILAPLTYAMRKDVERILPRVVLWLNGKGNQ